MKLNEMIHPKITSVLNLILGLFVAINSIEVKAQTEKTFLLTGNVNRADTILPIPYATIMNKRTHSGTVCNENGSFSIDVKVGDTLVFSSIGFEVLAYYIHQSVMGEKPYINILLKPKTYELDAVKITAYKSYDQFKKDFTELVLPEQPSVFLPPPVPVVGNTVPTVTVNGPFTALYNKLGKRPQQEKKAAELRIQNDYRKQASLKYNREMVSKLLKIKDSELDKFMQFCKLADQFVVTSTEYDLVLAVKACYNSFKEQHKM